MNKRRLFLPFLALTGICAALPLSAGGRSFKESGKPEAKKIDMVLMIETEAVSLTIREKVLPMVRARFPDINISSRIRDDAHVENVIKNSFVSGDSVDLVLFWPHQMRTFIDNGMALDLSPYLEADPAWRDSWIDGVLEDGRFDGKNYAVPFRTTYPLLQVNRELAAGAGVELKEQWTWEEFTDACEKIKRHTGAYPLGINSIWGCWLVRNGLMQIWGTDAELEAFTRGEIPFTEPRIKKVFENVKTLYDREYLYPGRAALTVTNDQVLSGFARGKIAILANVNGSASLTINNVVAGAFETAVVSWPNMGKPGQDHLLGSNDGYFIPSNSRYPGKAVEILKYLTGPEILRLYAEEGRIITFKTISPSNPDYPLFSRDTGKVHSPEIVNYSSELNDYIIYNIPANYILHGDEVLGELEALRKTVKP
jgi:ABC-type glycerol-3-phosphate transport system substrate-binding protein